MDYGRMAEAVLRLQHRHSDGSWGTMHPRPAHDPADLDPERDWVDGRIFACDTCDEQVRVALPVEDVAPGDAR